MTRHHDFVPEERNEPYQSLVSDLRQFYRPGAQDAQSLAHIRERLLHCASVVSEETVLPIPARPAEISERKHLWGPQRPWSRPLGVLASVVLMTLLVGSFLLLFDSRHGSSSRGTHVLATPTSYAAKGSWQRVPSPSLQGNLNALQGMAVLSTQDAWAVGHAGTRILIEHWNGMSWHVVSDPHAASGGLEAVAAASAKDVWAVGTTGSQTLIEHWNGSVWSLIKSPSPGPVFNQLAAITVISANDIWAVGAFSFNSNRDGIRSWQTLTLHWDGKTWRMVPSANQKGWRANQFASVTALSAENIWAAGASLDDTGTQGLIEHWDGKTWRIVTSPTIPAQGGVLNGIVALSENDIWAVGGMTTTPSRALMLHWDGTTWRAWHGSPYTLLAVVALSSRDVWAVGQRSGTKYPQTLILHWDGTTWNPITSPSPGEYNLLRAIEAVPGSYTIWAVGAYGRSPGNFTEGQTLIALYS